MKRSGGFTLLEVMVALVIVAFGMGAVLAALSSSADNISSLREKTLAQWVAMNQIADVRLNSNPPKRGSSEGDVKNFGGVDWHWRQDVMAVDMVPGLMEIAVRVRRATPGSKSGASDNTTSTASSANQKSGSNGSGTSSGAPGSFFSSSSGAFSSSGGFGSSGTFGASSGLGSLRSGLLSSSSGGAGRNIGAANLPATGDDQQWVVTVIGFRGDALGQATGESPVWDACASPTTASASGTAGATNPCGTASSGASSSSSGNATIGPSNGSSTQTPSQSSPSSSSGSNQP